MEKDVAGARMEPVTGKVLGNADLLKQNNYLKQEK